MKFISNKFTAEYPLYGATFIQSNTNEVVFLVTGGGGEGKNGIPNMITSYRYDPQNSQLDKLQDFNLPEDDDSPTVIDSSVAKGQIVLIGCNENSEKIKSGKGNKHLRKFQLDHKFKLKLTKSVDLFQSCNPEEYTKFLQISKDGKLAAVVPCVDSNFSIKIIGITTLDEKFEINDIRNEVKDIGFSPNGKYTAYITSDSLEVISSVTGKPITRLSQDFVSKGWNLSKMKFIDDETLLVVATQYKNNNKRDSGIVLIKVALKDDTAAVIKSKLLTKRFKGVTSMDLNESNNLLTLATNENSILVIQLSSFKIQATFNQVHSFAITKVVISSNGKYIVSVSAANTIHIIEIPDLTKDLSSNEFTSIQIGLSVILLLLVIIFYNLPTEIKQYFISQIRN